MNSQKSLCKCSFIFIAAVVISACDGFHHPNKIIKTENGILRTRSYQRQMFMTTDIPELLSPKLMYTNAVEIGASKGKAVSIPSKTFIKGILSGCYIAFGAYMKLTVAGACPGLMQSNPGLHRLVAGAFGLPLGVMMVVVTGGELFTSNTALLTAAVIEKKITLKSLLKNWFFTYAGNFVGSVLMAYLVFKGCTLGNGAGTITKATYTLSQSFEILFIRGILCNWLVCMAVYMASGCSSLVSKMVAIWFPISAFVALNLENCCSNMFYISLGMMFGAPVNFNDFIIKILLPVTLGNIVGGAVCVALAFAATHGTLLERDGSVKDLNSQLPRNENKKINLEKRALY